MAQGRQDNSIEGVVGDQLERISIPCHHAMAVGQRGQAQRIGISQGGQLHPRQVGQNAGMQLTEAPHTGKSDPQEQGRRGGGHTLVSPCR